MKTADLEPATLFVIKTIELVALDKLVSIDQQALNKWIACATQRHIVIFALKMAAVVGTILMFINHGEEIIFGTLQILDVIQIGLTYMVPYSVATYSSVNSERTMAELRSHG